MLVVHVEEWLFTPSVRLMLRPSQCSWRGLRHGGDVGTFRGLVLCQGPKCTRDLRHAIGPSLPAFETCWTDTDYAQIADSLQVFVDTFTRGLSMRLAVD